MSTSSVTTSNGAVIIARDDDDDAAGLPALPPHHGTVVHGGEGVYVRSDGPLDSGSFIAGLMLGMLLFFIVQSAMRWHARSEARRQRDAASPGPVEDRMAAEVAALARRTATLETIVTDPAQRTAREIDALR